MLSVFLMGGLGNTLFQIATLIAYCIQHKRYFVLPYSETLTTGQVRPTYWNTLFSELKKFTTEVNPTLHNEFIFNMPQYREPSFHYTPIPAGLENTLLWGYYQSPKYFDKYRDQVLRIMGVTQHRDKIRAEFADLLAPPGEPSISIHFRLGDYKEKQQYHPVLPYEYYERAIGLLPREYLQYAKILYFCEEEDRTHVDDIMTRLYEKYSLRLPVCVDHKIPDWKQLLIMSHCQVNIIANSSYSWWAAYLNDDPKKTVMYPSVWFGPAIQHSLHDLYPEGWIRVDASV